MAGRQNCDPSPAADTAQEFAKGNGKVIITLRYGWNGVSVWPDCEGPLTFLRVRNTDTKNWYGTWPRANGGARTFTITPGIDKTFTPAELSALGLTAASTIAGMTLTDTAP